MLKLVLFIPREHAVGGWRRWTATIGPVTYGARWVEEADGRYRPVAYRAVRSVLRCWIRVQFRPPVVSFFFGPNPTLTLTLTLPDDRPPIEVALVKF